MSKTLSKATRKFPGPRHRRAGYTVLLLIVVSILLLSARNDRNKRHLLRIHAYHGSAAKAKPCHDAGAVFKRYLFATIPRSGSTMTRELLEKSLGVATESVYPRDELFIGSANKDIRGAKGTYSDRSRAWGKQCGLINDCGRCHRGSDNDTVVVKTHFPFFAPTPRDDECISGIILTSRHPVDSYLAWWTYLEKQGKSNIFKFRRQWKWSDYLDLWAQHHRYWHAYATENGAPLLQFRYEDLCESPKEVMQRVLEFVGEKQVLAADADSQIRPCTLRNVRNSKRTEAVIFLHEEEVYRGLHKVRGLMEMFRYSDLPFANVLTDFFAGII